MDNDFNTYIVTRQQKRYIAKLNMKKEGMTKFCKHSYVTTKNSLFSTQTRISSVFAEKWRDYVEVSA